MEKRALIKELDILFKKYGLDRSYISKVFLNINKETMINFINAEHYAIGSYILAREKYILQKIRDYEYKITKESKK